MSDYYSLNETASRGRLAARGAGYPWGLADEVYRSVFWLVQRNFPAPLLLTQLLEHFETTDIVNESMPVLTDTHWSSRGEWLCPVLLGCALSDSIEPAQTHSVITFDNVKTPLLMLPFVADLAIRFKKVAELKLDSVTIATDGIHLRHSSAELNVMQHAALCSLTLLSHDKVDFVSTEEMAFTDRAQIKAEVWSVLGKFAHRTYAPATEASRNLGAGAGVLDND